MVDEPAFRVDTTAAGESLTTIVASAFRPTLPLVVAQASGALRRAGLEVRTLTPSSSDEQLAELVSGEVDVAHTALDNVVAWSAGAPVCVIGLVDLGVAHELVARDPILTLEQLRGHAIGVDSPRNGFVILLVAALASAGLDPDAYTLKPAGGLGRRADALSAGDVDACLLAGDYLTRALDAGSHRLLAVREYFPSYPALALVARRPLEGERRTVLTRYVGAMVEAARVSTTDSVGVAGLLGTDVGEAAAWLATERSRMTGVVTDADAAYRAIADGLMATDRIAAGDSIDPFTELLMDEVLP